MLKSASNKQTKETINDKNYTEDKKKIREIGNIIHSFIL